MCTTRTLCNALAAAIATALQEYVEGLEEAERRSAHQRRRRRAKHSRVRR